MTTVDTMTNDIRNAVEKAIAPKNIQIATVDVDTVLDDNDETDFLKIDIALDSPAHTIHPNERPVLTVLYENKCDLKVYLNTKMVGDDIVLKRRDNLYSGYNQSKIAEQVSRVTEEFLPIIEESLQKDAEWMVPLEMQPYLDTDLHSLYGEYLKDTQFGYQNRVVSTEFDHKRNAVHPMRSKYEISGEKKSSTMVSGMLSRCVKSSSDWMNSTTVRVVTCFVLTLLEMSISKLTQTSGVTTCVNVIRRVYQDQVCTKY